MAGGTPLTLSRRLLTLFNKLDLADDPTRITHCHTIGWNTLDNNAGCTDATVVTNGDSWTNNCSTPNPHIVANGDGRGHFHPRQPDCWVGGMVGRVNLHIGGDEYIVANGDPVAIENSAIEIGSIGVSRS